MVMNGFDTNFDRANEVYAANTIGFAYMDKPIAVKRDELVRVYLVNVLEYDLINSFHLHGNLFDYFPTGTGETPSRAHRHGDALPGPARDPRVALPDRRASSCSTPTSPSSPSSAGRASSRSRLMEAPRRPTDDDGRTGGLPAWLLGAGAAAADRRRDRRLRGARRPRARRAPRPAGRGARGREDGARAGHDRADRAQRRARRRHASPRRRSTTRSSSSPAPSEPIGRLETRHGARCSSRGSRARPTRSR